MPDDPGVLGNLPRSRPGRRSAKRDGKPAARKTTKATASRTQAKPKPRTQRKPTAARAQARPRPAQPQPAGDPVRVAIRTAGQVAGLGFKVAGEVFKRLPGR